jgi:alpha-L-rhamnosidase
MGGITANFDFSSGKCFVSAPKGTLGRIGIPKLEKAIRSIRINDKLAWDGTYHEVDGIGGANEDEKYIYFSSVEPAHYAINISYTGNTPAYQESALVYAAKFSKLDNKTSGNWGGVYGKDGHVLCNYNGNEHDEVSLPPYISGVNYFRAFPKNGMPEAKIWSASTKDKRALAGDFKNGAERKASCYSNPDNTMCFTVCADGKKEFQIALYFVDWENSGKRISVEMFDADTLDLIAPVKVLDHFTGGNYLVYRYGKSAKFRINKIRGDGVTLSGIFFDP